MRTGNENGNENQGGENKVETKPFFYPPSFPLGLLLFALFCVYVHYYSIKMKFRFSFPALRRGNEKRRETKMETKNYGI